MLAASDASAVRKIVAEFAVRGEERADEAAIVGDMKDAKDRRGWAAEGGAPIEGWVPAARYAQLVASLRSVGTIQPALPAVGFRATTADEVAASPAKQARTKKSGADLIFVRITLVPPGQ